MREGAAQAEEISWTSGKRRTNEGEGVVSPHSPLKPVRSNVGRGFPRGKTQMQKGRKRGRRGQKITSLGEKVQEKVAQRRVKQKSEKEKKTVGRGTGRV